MKKLNRHTHQSGMTLIEIMIALLISAFLIAGVIQLFLNSKQTYRMQENLSRLQENGRFAVEFIARDVRMAGYRTCLSGTVPSAISGTNDTGLNASDTLTIQMSLTACPVVISTLSYSINNGAGGQPSLFKNDGTNRELIEGIEDMQIVYGADINGDNTPDYFVPAGTTGLNMGQVVSIRATLTGRTLNANLTRTGDGRLRRVFIANFAVRNRLP